MITLPAILYWASPNVRDPGWRWVTPGSVLALIVWIVASLGLTLYVATFSSYSETLPVARAAPARERDVRTAAGGVGQRLPGRDVRTAAGGVGQRLPGREAVLAGPQRGLRAVGDADLAENAGQVRLDRRLADLEASRDELVR